MITKYKLALAILGAATVGGLAVQGLHAQTKPPVYVVIDIAEVVDAQAQRANTDRPTASTPTTQLGGKYLARSGKITALDGTPPARLILIAFDSVEKANAWNDSAEQKKVNDVRMKATKSRSFIVEGM
jgi:uncharacterized protein (DUF1330 family)